VQIAEWMGHSPVTLLTQYAHLIADIAEKPILPRERAINTARETQPTYTTTSSTTGNGHRIVAQLLYA
jgi:hypothetical protein